MKQPRSIEHFINIQWRPQQDMKRRAILRDRKRIEGKVNEARLIARLSLRDTSCDEKSWKTGDA